jgi:hypothetical protein
MKTVVIENENGISSGKITAWKNDKSRGLNPAIGDTATIEPTDENGMPAEEQTGIIIEIEE